MNNNQVLGNSLVSELSKEEIAKLLYSGQLSLNYDLTSVDARNELETMAGLINLDDIETYMNDHQEEIDNIYNSQFIEPEKIVYDFRDADEEELNEYIDWLHNKKNKHIENINNLIEEIDDIERRKDELLNSNITEEELNEKLEELYNRILIVSNNLKEEKSSVETYDRCINRTKAFLLEEYDKEPEVKPIVFIEDEKEKHEDITEEDLLPEIPLEPSNKKEVEIKAPKDKDDNELPVLESVLLKIITDEDGDVIDLTERQTRKYNYSNISVKKAFHEQTNHNNYIYNTTAVIPALAGALINFCRKISSKLLTREKTKEKVGKIKENIANLSDEEKETLYRHYRGNNLINIRELSAVDCYINEEIASYHDRVHIEPLREELLRKYESVFGDYNDYLRLGTLINSLKNDTLDEDDLVYLVKTYKIDNIEDITDGLKEDILDLLEFDRRELMLIKADQIDSILKLRNQIIDMQSGKGTHSINEDFAVKGAKYVLKGHRFSKKVTAKMAEGLLNQEKEIKEELRKAIASGNNLLATKKFLELNDLELNNTFEKATILGKVEAGARHYEPIPTDLDYRQDPLIRNSLISLAMIGSAISIMNNISNMKLAHDLDNVNITNKPGNNKDLAHAFENQAESNVANARVNREAAYQMDPEYGQYYMGSPAEDYAMHAADRAFYDSINTKIDTLKAGLNSGRITDAEYLRQMNDIRTTSAAYLQDSIDYLNRVMPSYSSSHNFDWEPVRANLEYLTSYKTAQDTIANTALDGLSSSKFETLINGEIDQLTTLTSTLPDNIKYSFIPAATALMLANYDIESRKYIPRQDRNERVKEMVNSCLYEEQFNKELIEENQVKKSKKM